jgi:hypothetical protein
MASASFVISARLRNRISSRSMRGVFTPTHGDDLRRPAATAAVMIFPRIWAHLVTVAGERGRRARFGSSVTSHHGTGPVITIDASQVTTIA